MSKNFSDKEGATKEEMWFFWVLASLVIIFQVGIVINLIMILFF